MQLQLVLSRSPHLCSCCSRCCRDLKRRKPQSGTLFNAMFNLHKFLNFENRDPFAARTEAREFAGLTDWDKFAKIEYYRLASEDEQEEVQMEAEEPGWL